MLSIVIFMISTFIILTSVVAKAASDNNWSWPTSIHYIQSDWPTYSSGKYHGGTDFPVSLNSPVYSTCDGEVVAVTSLTTSYGKHIKIRAVVNGETVFMRYCHLNSFAVSVGDKVTSGQLIGYSGSTGNSTGPHLHYEVRNANDYYGNASSPNLNPRNYLPGSGYSFETNDTLEKPTNVYLTKNQYWYDIQDTITLYPHADNATYFWLSVYKGDNHIVDQAIYGEYSFPASQWEYGDYYAWITAANSSGGTDSEGISFTVCGAPSYSDIWASKGFYDWDENEQIKINVSTICAKGQCIGIDFLDNNLNYVKRIITENCDTTFTVSAKTLGIGYFSAYFSVYNGSGGIDTKKVYFYVGQKKDIGAEFCAKIKNSSTNKYLTAVGDNVEGANANCEKQQVWFFYRLPDGSYKIKNYYDWRALDVHNYADAGAGTNVQVYEDWDSTAQRFYFYELCGSYYIKPICTDMVLDMSQSTYNLEVWGAGFDWSPQEFDIEKIDELEIGVHKYIDEVIKDEVSNTYKIKHTCSICENYYYEDYIEAETTVPTEPSLPNYIPGDVNNDKTVNMKDIALLQQYMNAWQVEINNKAADVNSDSIVNMKDIVLLQQYLNGWDVDLK